MVHTEVPNAGDVLGAVEQRLFHDNGCLEEEDNN